MTTQTNRNVPIYKVAINPTDLFTDVFGGNYSKKMAITDVPYLIIDIRDRNSFEESHIISSINVDLYSIGELVSEFDVVRLLEDKKWESLMECLKFYNVILYDYSSCNNTIRIPSDKGTTKRSSVYDCIQYNENNCKLIPLQAILNVLLVSFVHHPICSTVSYLDGGYNTFSIYHPHLFSKTEQFDMFVNHSNTVLNYKYGSSENTPEQHLSYSLRFKMDQNERLFISTLRGVQNCDDVTLNNGTTGVYPTKNTLVRFPNKRHKYIEHTQLAKIVITILNVPFSTINSMNIPGCCCNNLSKPNINNSFRNSNNATESNYRRESHINWSTINTSIIHEDKLIIIPSDCVFGYPETIEELTLIIETITSAYSKGRVFISTTPIPKSNEITGLATHISNIQNSITFECSVPPVILDDHQDIDTMDIGEKSQKSNYASTTDNTENLIIYKSFDGTISYTEKHGFYCNTYCHINADMRHNMMVVLGYFLTLQQQQRPSLRSILCDLAKESQLKLAKCTIGFGYDYMYPRTELQWRLLLIYEQSLSTSNIKFHYFGSLSIVNVLNICQYSETIKDITTNTYPLNHVLHGECVSRNTPSIWNMVTRVASSLFRND